MYEDYYNIKGSPFRLSPDPSFFFGSKGHNRALAYLQYGLKQKEGFIVITGSPGTGKTTLSRALLQDIAKKKIVVAELNTTHLEADDVLRMVTGSFGLEFENAPKATLLKCLEAYFLSRHRAGYHVLLIIDEAQNLPFESIEELRMLSNFYSGKHALIQIFLLGQEQLRDRLYSKNLEQLRQRVVASCHLEPLDQLETMEYIKHRLKRVGWQDDPQISDRAFARIYTVTKGIPRRINTFCDRLFLFGFLEGVRQLKDEHVKSVATELMYEVSAKEVKLSDIKPSDNSGKSDSTVETELLDSEQLQGFSDDVPDIAAVEKIEPPVELPIKSESRNNANNEPQTIRVVNNNTAMEFYEPNSVVSDDRGAKPDWWKLVALAVDYYDNPLKHKALSRGTTPLPEGGEELLKVAVGKTIIPSHMRTEALSDVSDEMLQKACTSYIQKTWLISKANYYRRLGVQSEADLALIRTQYRYLFRLLQTDKGDSTDDQAETYIRRINQAFSALRSDEKRKEYDAFLSAVDNGNTTTSEFNLTSSPDLAEVEPDNFSKQKKSDIVNEPAVEKPKHKRSNALLWSLLIIIMLLAIGGGTYYFQPNVDEIKTKIITLFQGDKPVNNVDEESSFSNESAAVTDQQSSLSVMAFSAEPVGAVKRGIDEVNLESAKTRQSNLISEPAEIEKPVVIAKSEKIAKPVVVAKPEKTVKPVVVAKPEKIAKPVAVIKPEKITKPPVVAKPVKAAPAKPVKSVPVVKPALSDKALSALVAEFSLTYEEGDLDKFMALFSKDVLTNNDENWDNIRRDYRSLFRSTEMRVIEIEELDWTKTGQSAAGKADFVVAVLRLGGDEIRKFTGQITLEVERVSEELVIKGMYHSYGDD